MVEGNSNNAVSEESDTVLSQARAAGDHRTGGGILGGKPTFATSSLIEALG